MPAPSLDEAARLWSASLGGTLEDQDKRTKAIIRLRSVIEYILRTGPRGSTVIKICHPAGTISDFVQIDDRKI